MKENCLHDWKKYIQNMKVDMRIDLSKLSGLFNVGCSGLFLLFFSSMFIIKTPPLYPACRQKRALNKHLEHYKDYVESINCPKRDKVDRKCINL